MFTKLDVSFAVRRLVYHLHYEVVYRGTRVNPRNYMDFDMPLDEYRAMLGFVKEESSTAGKRTSTTELLRRSKQGNG